VAAQGAGAAQPPEPLHRHLAEGAATRDLHRRYGASPEWHRELDVGGGAAVVQGARPPLQPRAAVEPRPGRVLSQRPLEPQTGTELVGRVGRGHRPELPVAEEPG
jgi:hypothetical protein